MSVRARNAKEIEEELYRVVGKAGGEIQYEIIVQLRQDTPKDTGWAYTNWFPSVGGPRTTPIGTKKAVNFGTAMAAAARLRRNLNWRTAVWISNAVPYIGILNDGYSRQAAADFVKVAVSRALSNVRRRKLT